MMSSDDAGTGIGIDGAMQRELCARHGAVTSSRGSGLPVAISRTIRARSNHSQRASNASSSAAAGSSPAPDDAIYCFKSAITARVYQFEAEAWKMSVTSLSTICGINSPSTSVSRRVDS